MLSREFVKFILNNLQKGVVPLASTIEKCRTRIFPFPKKNSIFVPREWSSSPVKKNVNARIIPSNSLNIKI